ncbi:MAG: hypothetical protein K6G40_03100 [Eubacterium sp.]|nr:hypothetical protein [Eubacterium sp.]
MSLSNEIIEESLKGKNIPILILDQKWHMLFGKTGKPESISVIEEELGDLLKRQGALNNEIKDLKKAKTNMMQQIVDNMEGEEAEKSDKKMDESTRLIGEINDKIQANDDELLDIPHKIKEVNDKLMIETMRVCYERLHTQADYAEKINAWIENVRIELKKNIIRKQEYETNNRVIYSYMHDVFGPKVIDIFDYNDEEERKEESSAE